MIDRRIPFVVENRVLLVVTAMLVVFGIVEVYGASSLAAVRSGQPGSTFAVRQLTGAVVGVVMFVLVARIDYHRWERTAWWLLGGVTVLLFVLLVPFADPIVHELNGARRWLSFANVTFQPSELAKLVVVVWTAKIAVKKAHIIGDFKHGMKPFVVVVSPTGLLILLEPDLSTAFLYAVLVGIVLFTAGAKVRHLFVIAVVAVLLAWALATYYQIDRIKEFFPPWGADLPGENWQREQSILGFGSGRFWGQGFGEGTQKMGYLPYAYSDFIFSTVGEEFGFLGASLLLAGLALFVGIGLHIARTAPDLYGMLLATGVTSLIGMTALLHIAVTLGMLPTTGLPLPFISYGRSNLLVSLMATGILLNIGRHRGRGPEEPIAPEPRPWGPRRP